MVRQFAHDYLSNTDYIAVGNAKLEGMTADLKLRTLLHLLLKVPR